MIGAVFFAVETAMSARTALFAACALFVLSITICAAFLSWSAPCRCMIRGRSLAGSVALNNEMFTN